MPLVNEPGSPDERERRLVPRLDVRLESVQADAPERPREHQLKPLAHIPMAGVRRDHAIPRNALWNEPRTISLMFM